MRYTNPMIVLVHVTNVTGEPYALKGARTVRRGGSLYWVPTQLATELATLRNVVSFFLEL